MTQRAPTRVMADDSAVDDDPVVGVLLTGRQVEQLRVWHDAHRLSCCATAHRPCCLAMILGDAPMPVTDQELIVSQMRGQLADNGEELDRADAERALGQLTNVWTAVPDPDGIFRAYVRPGSTPYRVNDPKAGKSYPVQLPFQPSPVGQYAVEIVDGVAVLTPEIPPDPADFSHKQARRSKRHR